MKKILYTGLTGLLILLAACQDWIDVKPKTDLKSQELFSDESGFKSALIGIYTRMTKNNTYGLNLTSGFLERLVQRYDNYKKDQSADERAKIYKYETENDPKNKIKEIWLHMYRNIANINNLLMNLETNGEHILTPGYRELIKGEALGLRAFHYFDLLRLWGPIYQEDSLALTIPWRDQFTFNKAPQIRANELAGHILQDLLEAEELLKDDLADYEYNYQEPFIGQRKYRMNKYAVKALLARVYLYLGNKPKAAQYAQEVIDHSGLKLSTDNRQDVSLYEETLFALNMYEMEERYLSTWVESMYFTDGRENWISLTNATAVFEATTVGLNDIRYRNGYGFIHNAIAQLMCRKYLPSANSVYTGNVPLIRLAEMYYILAECVSLEDSPYYINKVRNARGISFNYNITYSPEYTEEVRIEQLNKEYQKEFFAEGQYFYFLKRQHATTFYRCPVKDEFKAYTFPIPDNEVEFGNIDTE